MVEEIKKAGATGQPKSADGSAGENKAPHQKKFTMTEILLGSLVCIVLDIIAAIGDFFSLSILGDLVEMGTWPIFTFWFTIKGCKTTSGLVRRWLIPMLVDAIPFLPGLLITFVATTYMENNPEKFAALEKLETAAAKVPVKA